MVVTIFQIEIDRTDWKYERIEVPDVEEAKRATVLHDFEKVGPFYIKRFCSFSIKCSIKLQTKLPLLTFYFFGGGDSEILKHL